MGLLISKVMRLPCMNVNFLGEIPGRALAFLKRWVATPLTDISRKVLAP